MKRLLTSSLITIILMGNVSLAKPTREEFNKNGQIERQYYFDKEDMPYTGPEGFFMSKYLYDKQGRLVKILYFNTEGKACMAQSPENIYCAIVAYTYDAQGNKTALHYDKEGKLLPPKAELPLEDLQKN